MPRAIATKTLNLIAAAAAILQDIQPATVRGVCYQLFTRGLIANMGKNETARVSRVLTLARERGDVPWEWIVDETREVEERSSWRDPAEFMETVRVSYRKKLWDLQPRRVLVVSEKGTVGGLLRPVIHAYGVPFTVFHGFGSATALNDLAKRCRQDPRPMTLVYVGDHDPSGRHMSDVDIPERLADYGGVAAIDRVAVTPEQIRGRRLSTFSVHDKAKDARYRWFLTTHGESCCELDAMDPNELRATVTAAIEARIDWSAWDRALSTEAAEQASIAEVLNAWPV